MDLVHLGLSDIFMRCWYYWDFTVSGQMTAFRIPSLIVNLMVAPLLITQSSPEWRVKVDNGEGWSIGPGGEMVVIWFAIREWPWRRLTLVLQQWSSRTWMVLPSYWFVAGGMVLVSSGMTRVSCLDVCFGAHPGVSLIGYQVSTIIFLSGKRYDNDEVAGWCVDTTLGAGAGAYYTLRMGTCFFVRYKVTVLNMAARWHSCAVCFSPCCGIRLDGVVFWRTFVRLAHA